MLGEGLQAGDVAAEGEVAVADGERRVDVEGVQCRIVTGDERVPVDRRAGSAATAGSTATNRSAESKPGGVTCSETSALAPVSRGKIRSDRPKGSRCVTGEPLVFAQSAVRTEFHRRKQREWSHTNKPIRPDFCRSERRQRRPVHSIRDALRSLGSLLFKNLYSRSNWLRRSFPLFPLLPPVKSGAGFVADPPR